MKRLVLFILALMAFAFIDASYAQEVYIDNIAAPAVNNQVTVPVKFKRCDKD